MKTRKTKTIKKICMLNLNETVISNYTLCLVKNLITQKLNTNNEFISMYTNWVILLVVINLLVSTFIFITHSVKKR